MLGEQETRGIDAARALVVSVRSCWLRQGIGQQALDQQLGQHAGSLPAGRRWRESAIGTTSASGSTAASLCAREIGKSLSSSAHASRTGLLNSARC